AAASDRIRNRRVRIMRFPLCRNLLRQWVRSKLKVSDLTLRPLAAFGVPYRSGAVARPQPTTLPSALWIVDAAVHTALIEAQRVRGPEYRPCARLWLKSH